MARTAADLADITDLVMGGRDFSSSLTGSWDGSSIGFVNPDLWQPAPFMVEPNEDFVKHTVSDTAVPKI
jgi:hypothetical protein